MTATPADPTVTTAPAPAPAPPPGAPEAIDLHAALSSRTRPPQVSAWSASLAFGWRALLQIKHVPEQLFDVTVFPIMVLLMFTYFLGGALAGSPSEYLQALVPGILVMTITMITMYTGMTLNKDINKGVFDRFRSLPVWRPSALVGALLGDTVRYTMAAMIMLVVGTVLGFRPQAGLMGVAEAVALVLVFSFSLSWLWTTLGLTLRSPEAVSQVSMVVMFPLAFASNILVDPATMPPVVQSFVRINPITHLVTAVRGLMHGTATATQIGIVLAISAGLVVVFGPLTMRLFNNER